MGGALRRLLPVAVGAGLLAGIAFATYPATRSGEFRLVDAAGRPHTLDSFPPDTVLAVYFGYTTCLRACPVALDNIAAALEALGPDAASIRPVFVDLDPDRLALANMSLYLESFGANFLGLTGSPEALAEATRAFAVRVERLQFSADPTDYAMTHLSPIFVMRPNDTHPRSLPATSSPKAIESALRESLRRPPLA
jgi:protein SCO1/2